MQQNFDVLIIGAGAAGLLAALEIALTGRKVAVIEAKEIAGGRVHTITIDNYPVELGAEFVHGNLPLTLQLLEKAGLKKGEVKGSFWQKQNGKFEKQEGPVEDFSDFKKKFKQLDADIPLATFLSTYFKEEKYTALRNSLQKYAEGYYAANTAKSSTYALYEEFTESDDENFRIKGGYKPLIAYLEQQCLQHGVQFFFSQTVQQINWKKDAVEAITATVSFMAKKVFVTVSIGVLQADGIKFSPALPQKREAALQLGFGHVIKINLLFDEAFWKNEAVVPAKGLEKMSFVFSEEEIPTWWTQHPEDVPLITGWLGGPAAEKWKHLSKEELVQKAIQSLSAVFNLEKSYLAAKIKEACFYNWSTDAQFCGAYSYEVVNGEHYSKLIQQPVEETVFFAGEGLFHGPAIGTVEAALTNGRENAHTLIASFSKQTSAGIAKT